MPSNNSYCRNSQRILTIMENRQYYPYSAGIWTNFEIPVAKIPSYPRNRSKLEKKRSYYNHVHDQIRRHKHLIISPIVLIILALPRIILAFTLECMKSACDPVTLFLVGYFVSFIPPLLTFVAFVVPSKIYTKAFKDSMQSIRNALKHWLC